MSIQRALIPSCGPIPALGLGCMGLGGRFERDASDDDGAIGVIRAALDAGVALFDTAEVYGDGHGEEVLGAALRGRGERVVLASKVSPENVSAGRLAIALDGSLRRLGVETIDLYQVHWPSATVPIAETAEALARAVEQGKVKSIGLSNFSLTKLKAFQAASAHPVASLQVEYNLFDRSIESELLPYCRKQGIAVIAYSPLDQGRVTGSRQARRDLDRIAQKCGVTPQQLALAWLMHQQGVFVIPKAGRLPHLTENVASLSVTLDQATLDEIAAVSSASQKNIPCRDINPLPREGELHGVYQTLEEARKNRFNSDPSPLALAEELKRGDMLKLPRVAPSCGNRPYDLIEGRMRYWAWCLAFGEDSEIPVLIRG